MAIQRLLVNTSIPSSFPVRTVAPYTGRAIHNAIGQTAPSLVPGFIKRGYNNYIEALARGMGKLAQTKSVKSFVEFCTKNKVNYSEHFSALCANILNGFYLYNVYKSPKIEKDQKKPLMLNMFISTALSTVAGYALNKTINSKLKEFDNAIIEHYGARSEAILSGFKLARSLLVFQLLYRFVAPVIATPLANTVSNKIREKSGNNVKLPT